METVRFLAGIDERMKFHQEKMAMLHKLSISDLKAKRKSKAAEMVAAS